MQVLCVFCDCMRMSVSSKIQISNFVALEWFLCLRFKILCTVTLHRNHRTSAPIGFKFYSKRYIFFYAFHHPVIQILNFGEDEIISMFYACGLHVLCIVLMLICTPPQWKIWCWWRQLRLCQVKYPSREEVLRGNKVNFYSSNY
jgi:hypothetical protein